MKKIIVSFLMMLVMTACANGNKPIGKLSPAEDMRHKEFIEGFEETPDREFFLMGDTNTDLSDFESVTFYIGTSDEIKDLDSVFRDYAQRIGEHHTAIFLEYGTQDYSKRLDEIKCFHLTPFEVPAVVYVDLKRKKCYYFSHENGKLLAKALLQLSKRRSNINSIRTEFELEAAVEDVVEAFPSLKALRDLILRVSRHIFL